MQLLESLAPDDELASRFALTPREATIARHLTWGLSNEAIARATGISPHTVRKHAERVRTKLGARTRAQVAFELLLAAMARLRACEDAERERCLKYAERLIRRRADGPHG